MLVKGPLKTKQIYAHILWTCDSVQIPSCVQIANYLRPIPIQSSYLETDPGLPPACNQYLEGKINFHWGFPSHLLRLVGLYKPRKRLFHIKYLKWCIHIQNSVLHLTHSGQWFVTILTSSLNSEYSKRIKSATWLLITWHLHITQSSYVSNSTSRNLSIFYTYHYRQQLNIFNSYFRDIYIH